MGFTAGARRRTCSHPGQTCRRPPTLGPHERPTLRFGWKKNPPDYFEHDNPGEAIEPEGWFCDVFVFGVHLETDEAVADQVDVNQWQFLVIPVCDLHRGQGSMVLTQAMRRWQPVSWLQLPDAVEQAIGYLDR